MSAWFHQHGTERIGREAKSKKGEGIESADCKHPIAGIGACWISGTGYPDLVIIPNGSVGRDRHIIPPGPTGSDGNAGKGFQDSATLEHVNLHRFPWVSGIGPPHGEDAADGIAASIGRDDRYRRADGERCIAGIGPGRVTVTRDPDSIIRSQRRVVGECQVVGACSI